jgi:ATP-binding protein involved in chromosome partitioning
VPLSLDQGPSIPTLISPINGDVAIKRSKVNSKFVKPLVDDDGVQFLSFGHVNRKSGVTGAGGQGAAIIRGPIASRVINQLVAATEWDDVDYLIVDMPPGTGDVQITLTQSIAMTGAIIVTTPHELSLVDAAKGVAMFSEVHVPTLAVVSSLGQLIIR